MKRQIKQANSTAQSLQLIYAGGTFGSYGKPLEALPADVFLPLLMDNIHQKIGKNINVLANSRVKDSSQLSPEDLVHFFELILTSYANGQRQFIIITGTDTLSFFGAFLAEAFAGSDICIVLTASMRPLFDADNIHEYVIDEHSDAWRNLSDAIGQASHGESGVFISIAGETWPAQTVQKIHSHDLMAFTGHHRVGYPANSYIKSLPPARKQNWVDDLQALTKAIHEASQQVVIPAIYCVPNQASWLNIQLSQLLELPPTGVILIGFGAGNLPYSKDTANTLDKLYQQGHMVVSTTQSPYGGVSDTYAAGSWQYDHHVLSAGRLTIPAVYARLLWLHLSYDTPAQRRRRWTYSVSKH